MTDTKPAPKDIRIGAKVTVEGRVTHIATTGDYRVEFSGAAAWLDPEAFLTVENPPEELKVGDTVLYAMSGATVIAIHANEAWLKLNTPGLGYATANIARLEKLPS